VNKQTKRTVIAAVIGGLTGAVLTTLVAVCGWPNARLHAYLWGHRDGYDCAARRFKIACPEGAEVPEESDKVDKPDCQAVKTSCRSVSEEPDKTDKVDA